VCRVFPRDRHPIWCPDLRLSWARSQRRRGTSEVPRPLGDIGACRDRGLWQLTRFECGQLVRHWRRPESIGSLRSLRIRGRRTCRRLFLNWTKIHGSELGNLYERVPSRRWEAVVAGPSRVTVAPWHSPLRRHWRSIGETKKLDKSTNDCGNDANLPRPLQSKALYSVSCPIRRGDGRSGRYVGVDSDLAAGRGIHHVHRRSASRWTCPLDSLADRDSARLRRLVVLQRTNWIQACDSSSWFGGGCWAAIWDGALRPILPPPWTGQLWTKIE